MTEDDWTSQRKQTIYEESKRVMQGQKADIDDMDDKALRTVRLNAAILAIGATGLEISGIGEINFLLAGLSIVFLVSSAIFGVIVYNESNILVGPKSSFLGKMRTQKSDDGWEKELLEEMETWITDNQTRVELNGALLTICQSFLVLGVLTGVPAILGASFESFQQQDVQVIIGATVALYAILIVYLRSSFDIPD
jgi:urea transporter